MMSNPTHYAYSDESCFTTSDDYGTIAILNFKAEIKSSLEEEVLPLIAKIPVEYKWIKFKNEHYLDISKRIFDVLFKYAEQGCLRIDSIIWETNDIRYPRNQTNSGDKLNILYYIRLRNMFSKRWGKNTRWAIYADKQNQVDWEELKEYLQYYSMTLFEPTILGQPYDIQWLKENKAKFSIDNLTPVDSRKEPLIGIADIFAGLAAYSHNNSKTYLNWQQFDPLLYNPTENQLLLDFIKPATIKSKDIHRCKFLKYVQDRCKENSYHVSIKKKKGLHTFTPKSPFNFFYAGTGKYNKGIGK